MEKQQKPLRTKAVRQRPSGCVPPWQPLGNFRSGQGETGLFPGFDAAAQGFDFLIALIDHLHCPTGRGPFFGSGAIEDDLLFMGNVGQAG